MSRAAIPPMVPLIDSNEQLPYQFIGCDPVFAPLFPWSNELRRMAPLPGAPNVRDGDYTLRGGEHLVRIERKSLDDYLRCVGTDRARFEAELNRLVRYPLRFLLLEFCLPPLAAGLYQGLVHPHAAVGSAIAWAVDLGVQVVFAGDRRHAMAWCRKTLERVHRNLHSPTYATASSEQERGSIVPWAEAEGRETSGIGS